MSDYTDEFEQFEQTLKQASEGTYVLKLYVSGSSTRSAKAVSNLRAICDTYLVGRYELEVIDLFQQPEMAQEQQLLAAPTLIKQKPEPIRRLVGDLSDTDRVLYSLNLQRQML
ncbi:MAG TPA: circadian clock KaiB family protein [Fimbriimonas sp.]|nr:circadian clock KaiB family protein [Fimbriimonas sp.]